MPVIQSLALVFALAPWKAPCEPVAEGAPMNCGVPMALPGVMVGRSDFDLKLAETPGTVTLKANAFDLQGEMKGALTLFSVYPRPEQGFPEYIQVRLEITHPVRALCVHSIQLKDPMRFPPLICASLEASTQWGLTLTQTP